MLDLSRLPEAVRSEGGVSRRLLFAYGAALAALPAVAGRSAADRRVSFASDPFALGVASGDPDSAGAVLWTRLAPKPLEPDGGMPPDAVPVQWEVAEDDGFRTVVRQGEATAAAELGHSVHVEVAGLKPDRWYFYRFRAGDAVSPVGRTRTLPDANSSPDRLRFAFASCQHFEAGLYTAYGAMAGDELDLVVHLGDYIYEGAGADKRVRRHVGSEIQSLGDYRVRHAQYRSDAMLQAMHARCPWFLTWDDHEVANNYAGDIPAKKGTDPAAFLRRRAAAYQAYYEAMPLRASARPQGPNLKLYRKASWGRLAELYLLDTRQYRSDQPNGDKRAPLNAAALDPRQTMLGRTQREWLLASLAATGGAWNVLAQQVMMALVARGPGKELGYSMDQWPGYAHERMELVRLLADRKIPNPVVLTGDIHSNWCNELRIDDREPGKPVVAAEFVGTSISSGGNGSTDPKPAEQLMADNPGVKFHNRQRGYVRCEVTPAAWRSEYVAIDQVTRPGGRPTVAAAFAVEAGRPGISRA